MSIATFDVILPGNALVLAPEAHWVTETPTGLRFEADTPLEVWAGLITRLLHQRKVLEWALADAINFGEHAYGDMYSQWVDETGLHKHTLTNIAAVGRRIELSRRRDNVSFAHHAEVAYLPVSEQESLLDSAESAGMTRYDLRDAVRERKRQLAGGAVSADGASLDPAPLAWVPDLADLTAEARAALEAQAPLGRLRSAWVAGALWSLVWHGDEDCFLPGRWHA
jgi:hypothetical protein